MDESNSESNSVSVPIVDPEKQKDRLLRAYRRQKICRQFLNRQTLDPNVEDIQLTVPSGTEDHVNGSEPSGPPGSSNSSGQGPSGSGQIQPNGEPTLSLEDPVSDLALSSPREVKRIYDENTKIINDAKNIHDLDDVVDQTIDGLCVIASKQGNYNYYKSIGFKSLDTFIYITVSALMATIAAISLRNSVYNAGDTGGQDYQDTFFLIGILTIVTGAINEMGTRFKLNERSKVLRQCYHRFREKEQELRFLRFSSDDPLSILDKIEKIERQLDAIDMQAFDSQIVNANSRESVFRSKVKTGQNVRPEDIPANARPNDIAIPAGSDNSGQNTPK